eukprot:SAG31_NODE_4608_length_3098_cov_3.502167_1_plen_84_part_10
MPTIALSEFISGLPRTQVYCTGYFLPFYLGTYPNVGIYFSYPANLQDKRLWAPVHVLNRAHSKLRSGLQLRGAECCWGSILMGP